MPEPEQAPWRAFGEELGPLFQLVDDILDEDGAVLVHGVDGGSAAGRRRGRAGPRSPGRVQADTSVLEDIVAGLAARTA